MSLNLSPSSLFNLLQNFSSSKTPLVFFVFYFAFKPADNVWAP
jgi:hypothetical protein